jgi:hypothetical protein
MKRPLIWGIALLVIASLYWIGCSKSNNPVSTASGSPGQVTMTAYFTQQGTSGLYKVSSTSSIDSIVVTRVRVILKDLKLKSQSNEDVDMDHEDGTAHQSYDYNHFEDSTQICEHSSQRLAPFVLDLSLTDSVQQISIDNFPAGTYDGVKFEIHRIDQDDIDSLSSAEQATFADFLAGSRYSVIIDGNYYQNGQATPFTYKSQIDAEIELPINPPLVVDSTQTTVNLTLRISSAGWFVDSNNNLIDPTDSTNAYIIDQNLKNFLSAYRDNNRDCQKD